MQLRIAIVNSSSFGKHFPEHVERLRALGEVAHFDFPADIDGSSLAEALQGYNVIIASVKPYFTREFFEYKDHTLLIARHGIGVDNVHLPSAAQRGVLVTKVTPWVEREAVAEHTVALLLDILRGTHEARQAVYAGQWAHRARFVGFEIKGKTVGIIGIGNIGSRVAEILRNGFGAHTIAYDPYLSPDTIRSRAAEPVGLDELLRQSDIISLNASLNTENYHMLSHREFALMKQGVFLVNTARGELIDEDALVEALESGKVAAIGMDVVEGEPIEGNHRLLKYPNVLIVPHIAAYTRESLRLMGEKVVADVERVARGEMPEEVVAP
ncbi:MAG: D-isomer specific 2-hydroxyacid dehydrogenase family protein [Armatimonadetes bacterium]|nr:D-isomer specific 2-hydroxyacid dehydrogenase family protein [Armatimonadota bacterium]